MWKVKYVNINSKNKWALVKLWIIKSWCNVGLKRLFHFLLTWFGWCQNIKMFLSSKIYVCISTWFVMWLLVSKYDNVSHFGNFFIIDWQIFIASTSFSQHFFFIVGVLKLKILGMELYIQKISSYLSQNNMHKTTLVNEQN